MTSGLRNAGTDIDADVDVHRSPPAKIGVGLGWTVEQKKINMHSHRCVATPTLLCNSTDDSDQTTRLYLLIHSSLRETSLLSSWFAMFVLKPYSSSPISTARPQSQIQVRLPLSVTKLLCFSICKVNQSDCSCPIYLISFLTSARFLSF
jgi:hypothetical protein